MKVLATSWDSQRVRVGGWVAEREQYEAKDVRLTEILQDEQEDVFLAFLKTAKVT